MLEMPKSREISAKRGLHTGSGTSPKERSRFQAAKLEGQSIYIL